MLSFLARTHFRVSMLHKGFKKNLNFLFIFVPMISSTSFFLKLAQQHVADILMFTKIFLKDF